MLTFGLALPGLKIYFTVLSRTGTSEFGLLALDAERSLKICLKVC